MAAIQKQYSPRSIQAFSLVELSIVLVILGLLVGGVLTGQSLIRAAELRSISTQLNQYLTATQTFRDRFFALPGDMRNAEDFWNTMSNCGTGSASGTGTQTCNGDGDGTLEGSATVNANSEYFTFWQHLANAGLIEGSYTGISGTAGLHHAIVGENTPPGRISSSGWSVVNHGTPSGNAQLFDGIYNNAFMLGGQSSTLPNLPFITPEEIWNVDTKTDDGQPATGRVVPRNRVNCTVFADGSTMTSDATGAAALDAEYNLTDTSSRCALIVRNTL